MENLSFSKAPFEDWQLVEVLRGFLYFPREQSLNAPLTANQQPMADVPFRRLNNNPGRVRPQPTFNVPPPRNHGSGAWTTQNSSWETVTFDQGDPNINNFPFPRQIQKKVSGPSLKFHGNSRAEYLESFKKHQHIMKEAERQHLATNIQEPLNETEWSTSDEPVQSNNQPSEFVLEQDQIDFINVYDSQSGDQSNFRTPSRQD
jgi:hypothetical protein